MGIRGIIFDMDGLMIDTEKWLNKYWCEAAKSYGFAMTEEHALQIRSLSAPLASEKLKFLLGEDFPYEKVRDKRRFLMAEHVKQFGVEKKQGLDAILTYAKEEKYRLAVATATDFARTEQYLRSIQVYDYFDAFVCGSMVKHGKPAPDIYIEAAKQLQLSPSECIALEDSPNGVLSAYRAGCKPIMVPDLDVPTEETKAMLYGLANTLDAVVTML